jgi:hypothetical protein
MKLLSIFAATMISLSLISCSSFRAYEGPVKPDSETALITATVRGDQTSGFVAYFISVDDYELAALPYARVLPGRRCAMVHARGQSAMAGGGNGRSASTRWREANTMHVSVFIVGKGRVLSNQSQS